MYKAILALLVLILSTVASAKVKIIETDEELKAVSLRNAICESLIYDYFDYGEHYEGDVSLEEACADMNMTIVQKVISSFPKGKTPKGFKNRITTIMHLKVNGFVGGGSCSATITKSLPSEILTIDEHGEIVLKSSKGSGWSAEVDDCD